MSDIEIISQGEIDVEEQELADFADEPGVDDVPVDESASVANGDEGLSPEEEDAAISAHMREIIERNEAKVTKAEPTVDDDIAAQIEEATVEVCEAQERAQDKRHKADELTLQAKDAKDAAKAADDDLRDAARRLRKLREGRFPDGDRYPMFDKDGRKAEVNASFPKPEAIQPLPAQDYSEHYRRQSEKCGLETLGLKPATLKVLTELGLKTVADYGRKALAIGEAGADLTSIKGMTERRIEEIANAIEAVAEVWSAEWESANPEADAAEDEADVEEAERRLADPEQVPIPYEQAVAEREGGEK